MTQAPMPGSIEEAMSFTSATQEPDIASPVSSYRPVFSYANRAQLDADPTGERTIKYGQETGQVLSREDIVELNVGGKIMPVDQLRGIEGGEELINLARLNRRGRKGFLESINPMEGSATDFVPYVGDLASVGISIANMSKARDAMKKAAEGGMDALSDQERVWLSVYEQDSLRAQNQTWGATVGTILRQAPAFGIEFMGTGALLASGVGTLPGLAIVGKKIGTKAAAKLAKEATEELFEKVIKQGIESSVKRELTEKLAQAGASRAALEYGKEAAQATAMRVARESLGQYGVDVTTKAGNELLERLVTRSADVATTYATAFKNPSIVRAWKDFAVEYGKRGFMGQYDDLLGEGVSMTVKERLREFAGVALIEAPIRGAIQGTFDFAVVNPIVTRVMGGTEAVTRNELMFAGSEDKGIREGAKFLAWGTALAEYASENSGEAFNALGSIVRDVALRPAAKGLVSRGLRAVDPKGLGRFVDDAIRKHSGTAEQIKDAVTMAKREAIRDVMSMTDEAALKSPVFGPLKTKIAGMTADQIAADPKLVEEITKNVLTSRDKSFLGFWMADKMSSKGWTPDKASSALRAMGYNEVLGEFMEERYNGFAQGLFGLDGTREDSMGTFGRIAHAMKSSMPDTAGQGFAEIVAFAMPMAGRAMISRAFSSLGTGHIGNVRELSSMLNDTLGFAQGQLTVEEDGRNYLESVAEIKDVEKPDSEAARIKRDLGQERAASALSAQSTAKITERLVTAGMEHGRISEVGDTALVGGAKMILRIAEAVITHNPFALFSDPAGAIMHDRLGLQGKRLLEDTSRLYKQLFHAEAAVQARKRIEDNLKPDEAVTKEAIDAFVAESTNRKAIDDAIRPRLQEMTQATVSRFLAASGAMVVTEAMIDREVASVAEHRRQIGSEMTDEEKAKFKKEFRSELKAAAEGNMRWDEQGGRGQFIFVEKSNSQTDVMSSIKDMMHNEFGANNFLDLSVVADPKRDNVGKIWNGALAAKALSGDVTATLQYIRENSLNIGSTPAETSIEDNLVKAREHARLMSMASTIISPVFKDQVGQEVEIYLTAGGKAALRSQPKGSEAIEEGDLPSVVDKLLARGFSAKSRNIIETAYNSAWTPVAAALLHPSMPNIGLYTGVKNFLAQQKLLGNPFLDPKYANDFQGAMAEALRQIEAAKRNGTVPQWETDAKALAKDIGVKEYDNPSVRGQQGYLIAYGATNDGANIYIPRSKVGSSPVHLIEDMIERMARDSAARRSNFEMRLDNGKLVYHPAMRAFLSKLSEALVNYRAEQARLGVAGSTFAAERARRTERMIELFRPDETPNEEAISKTVTAYGFQLANLTSRIGGGTYYDILTAVADKVNGTKEAHTFRSLVNRFVQSDAPAVTDPMEAVLGEDGGYLGMLMRNMAPSEIRVGALAGMPESGGAVALPGESGKVAGEHIAKARTGEAYADLVPEARRAEFLADVKKAYGSSVPAGYLPEDIPYLVEAKARSYAALEAQAGIQAGHVDELEAKRIVAEAAAPVVAPAAVPVANAGSAEEQKADADNVEGGTDKPSSNVGPSVANLLRDAPELAFLFAGGALSRKGLVAKTGLEPRKLKMGNDDDIRVAFDFWKEEFAPMLSEEDFKAFSEQVKASWAKADKKANASAIDKAKAAFQRLKDFFANATSDAEMLSDDSDATSAENADGQYDELSADAARNALAKDPMVRSFTTILGHYMPGTDGVLTSIASDLFMSELDGKGNYDEDSVTSLFDAKPHANPHKAMRSADDFSAWVKTGLESTREDDAGRLAFFTTLEALGYEASFKLLVDIRGVTPVGAFRGLDTDTQKTWGRTEINERYTSIGGAEVSVVRALRTATSARADATIATARKLSDDRKPAPSLDAAADRNTRVAAVLARMAEFVPVANSLLGPGNVVTAALVNRITAENLVDSGQDNGLLFAYTNAKTKATGAGAALARALSAGAEAVKAGKSAEAAASEIFDRKYQVSKDAPRATQRGAMHLLLSNFAPANLPAQIRRPNGEGSVKLMAPSRSPAMARFLEAAAPFLKKFGARASARLARNAVYADGTPMFWNAVGLTVERNGTTETVGTPTAKMVLRAARKMSKGGMFYLPLFKGDKTNLLGVTVPEELARLLTGQAEGPMDYGTVYRAAANAAGMDSFAPKRAPQLVQGFGAEIEAPKPHVIAAVVPSDPAASDDLKEFTLGGFRVFGPATKYLSLASKGGSKQSLFKVHGFTVGKLHGFLKGVARSVSDEPDTAGTPASLWMDQMARDLSSEDGNGGRTVVLGSLDEQKEGRLNSKFNGVLVNGKVIPAAQFISGNPEVNESTEVTWRNAGEEPAVGPLSAFLPGLKIRRNVKTAGTAMATVISYHEDISWRKAATLYHGAEAGESTLGKNIARDPGYAAANTRLAAEALSLAFAAAHPEAAKAYVARDPYIADLVARGLLPNLSAMLRDQIGLALATNKDPDFMLGNSVDAVCISSDTRTVGGAEQPVVGPAHAYSSAVSSLVGREGKFGGRAVRAARVAMNIRTPGARAFSLVLNPKHAAFKMRTDAQKVEAVKARLDEVAKRELAGDRDGALAYLADEVMPIFLDMNGKPLPPGMAVSFSDLYDSRGFDYTAFRWNDGENKDSPDPEGRVVLDGIRAKIVRTPSGDPAAWFPARVYGPATAGEDATALFVEIGEDGKPAVRPGTLKGERLPVPADEAVIRAHANTLVFTGHDNDGDKLRALFRQDDPNKPYKLAGTARRFEATEANLEAAIKAVANPDRKVAEAALTANMMLLRNAWLEQTELWWEQEFLAGVEPTAPLSFGDADAAITAAAQAAGWKKFIMDATDPDSANEGSDLAKDGSSNRGIGVSSLASLDTLFNILQSGGSSLVPVSLRVGGNSTAYMLDSRTPPTAEQWRFVRQTLFARNNLLFDVMKNFGLDVKYGFTKALMPVHDALLYMNAAKIKDKAGYAKFMETWVTFAHGPAGQAMNRRMEAEVDPAITVPTKDFDTRMKLLTSVFGLTEKGKVASPAEFKALSPISRDLVLEGARAAGKAARSSGASEDAIAKEAKDTAAMLIEAFRFSESLRAVKDVMEADTDKMNTPFKMGNLRDSLKLAEGFLSNMKLTDGGKAVWDSAVRNLRVRMLQVGKSFQGAIETSELGRMMDAPVEGKRQPAPSGKRAEAAHRAALTVAAAGLAPASTSEKIPAKAKESSTEFRKFVETVYEKVYQTYATSEDPQVRGMCPFMDALVAPYRQGAAVRDYAIRPVAADDTEASMDAIIRGSNWLRDTAGSLLDTPVEAYGAKTVFTANDMWHLLRIYTAMAGRPALRASPKNVSFLPFFGPAANRELFIMQPYLWNVPSAAENLMPMIAESDEKDVTPIFKGMKFGGADFDKAELWYEFHETTNTLRDQETDQEILKLLNASERGGDVIEPKPMDAVTVESTAEAPVEAPAEAPAEAVEAPAETWDLRETRAGLNSLPPQPESGMSPAEYAAVLSILEAEVAAAANSEDMTEAVLTRSDLGELYDGAFEVSKREREAFRKSKESLLPLMKVIIEEGIDGFMGVALIKAATIRASAVAQDAAVVVEPPVLYRVLQAPAKIPGQLQSGPGTPLGTGADQMMRDAMKASWDKGGLAAGVFVFKPAGPSGSTNTSLEFVESLTKYDRENKFDHTYSVVPIDFIPEEHGSAYIGVAMIAGNSGTRLTPSAKKEIEYLNKAGFEFVVGSMKNHTDSDASEFVRSIGGKVTVYDWAGRAEAPATQPTAPASAAVPASVEVVKLGFGETPPAGVISGMRGPGGSTMATAKPADYGKPSSGWLGNPFLWSGNANGKPADNVRVFATVEGAIDAFRKAFLAKVESDAAFRSAVLAVRDRGMKLGYYRPQGEGQSGKHHLQAVQEWLSAQPAAPVSAAVPASVDDFVSFGKDGRPVRVRRDAAVGWIVSQGAVTAPATDEHAAKYYAKRPPAANLGAKAALDSIATNARSGESGFADLAKDPADREARAAKHNLAGDAHGKAGLALHAGLREASKLSYLRDAQGQYSGILEAAADLALRVGAMPELSQGAILAMGLESRAHLETDGDVRAELKKYVTSFSVNRKANEDLLKNANYLAYFSSQSPAMKVLVSAALTDVNDTDMNTAKAAYDKAAKVAEALNLVDVDPGTGAGQVQAGIRNLQTYETFIGIDESEKIREARSKMKYGNSYFGKWSDRWTELVGKKALPLYPVSPKLWSDEGARSGKAAWNVFAELLSPNDVRVISLSGENVAFNLYAERHHNENSIYHVTRMSDKEFRPFQNEKFVPHRRDATRQHELEVLWRSFTDNMNENVLGWVNGFDSDAAIDRIERTVAEYGIEMEVFQTGMRNLRARIRAFAAEEDKDVLKIRTADLAGDVNERPVSLMDAEAKQIKEQAMQSAAGYTPPHETGSYRQDELGLGASVMELQDRVDYLANYIGGVNDAITKSHQKVFSDADKLSREAFVEAARHGEVRRINGQGALPKLFSALMASGQATGEDQLRGVEAAIKESLDAMAAKGGNYMDIVRGARAVMDGFLGTEGLRAFARLGETKNMSGYRGRMIRLGSESVRQADGSALGVTKMIREAVFNLSGIADPAERQAELDMLMSMLQSWQVAKLAARVAASSLYKEKEVRDMLVGPAAQSPASRPDGTPLAVPQDSAFGMIPVGEDGIWDPMTYTASLMDTDAFYAGAVAPFFRGYGIRDILFDKEALTALPFANNAENFITGYLGTRSAAGYLAPIETIQVEEREGGGGRWTGTGKLKTALRIARDKMPQQFAKELAGSSLNQEEMDLMRIVEIAMAFVAASGLGAKSKLVFDGMPLQFSDLGQPTTEAEVNRIVKSLTVAEAARLHGIVGTGTGADRMTRLHLTLLGHQAAGVPTATLARVEAAIQDAARTYLTQPGTQVEREQATFAHLMAKGTLEARYDTPRGSDNRKFKQTVFAVPASWIAEEFAGSSAKAKLLAAGREESYLDLLDVNNPLIAKYREAMRRVNGTAKALGIQGASRFMHDAGTVASFHPGTGVHKYNARLAERPLPGKLDAELEKQAQQLLRTFNGCFYDDKTTGKKLPVPLRADDPGGLRMVSFLIDLHSLKTTPEALVAEIKHGVWSGGNGLFQLPANATKWDVAKAVYAGGAARLYQVAMNGGEASSLKLGQIGLADFNRLIERTALENQADGELPMGATWSDIYEMTGALPASTTLSEHLAQTAQGVANATRYRAAFNNLLMATDEEGMPTIYMRPGADDDDTVPDRIWEAVARWWAQIHAGRDGKGAFYDEAQSGRENARRLFDEIDRNKHATGETRGVRAGVEQHVFETVQAPEGFGAASKIIAARPRAGDDSQSFFDTRVGGEAAGIVKQVLAIPGVARDDVKWSLINNVLSWSKSSSVMASFFFPIATAFESPVASSGMLPTIAGFSEHLSKLARKTGVAEDSPMMKEFFNMLGSDSDFLVDNMVLQTLCGIEFASRSKNMTDHDRSSVAKDVNMVVAAAKNTMGEGASRNLRLLLEGAMEHSTEFAFEYVINATKMAVFAQMSAKVRRTALEKGRWFDPVRSLIPYRNYINAEVGGIDPAMYAWMTPTAQRWLKLLMFSAPWTLGAWEAGGAGVLSMKLFGKTTSPEIRQMMLGRWVRMYFGVMLGVPAALQLMSVAFAKMTGDDDKDDKWFTWQNEGSRKTTDADMTPFLRAMDKSHVLFLPFLPTWGDLKKSLPASVGPVPLGALIPALTGREGDDPTTRRRRYYMHFGKQGWEVARWFEEPWQSLMGKMSMPAQKTFEGLFGYTAGTGWETPFADTTFWERWTSLDPEKSAAMNLLGVVQPFSFSGTIRNPEAGALSMFGVVGKGVSRTRAVNEMAEMFTAWSNADSYVANKKGRPGAWTDLMSFGTEWMDALRLNGHDAPAVLKEAVKKARQPLYEQIHKALPQDAKDPGRLQALEEAARGMIRLDYIHKDLLNSVKNRDKLQHIDRRAQGIGKLTDEMLREAFFNSSGATNDVRARQSAMAGGDVIGFLASDNIPKTVLGYKVVPPNELTEEDLAFFAENKEAAGFFKRG